MRVGAIEANERTTADAGIARQSAVGHLRPRAAECERFAMPLNPVNLPQEFRYFLTLADRWGIGDDSFCLPRPFAAWVLSAACTP